MHRIDAKVFTCPECGEPRPRLYESGLCGGCDEKRIDREVCAEACARTLSDLSAQVERRLELAGLARRERSAVRERIPSAIAKAIPRDVTEALKDGRSPERGFGLWGATGCGKTQAIACLVRVYVEGAVRRLAPEMGVVPDDVGLTWCSWVEEADWLRKNGKESALIAKRIRRLSEVPVLVLDDLARERRRGAPGEDFASGQLDVVLDARSRDMRPTIWTANLGAADLTSVYGAALVSRLEGENPGAQVKGQDLRIQRSA